MKNLRTGARVWRLVLLVAGFCVAAINLPAAAADSEAAKIQQQAIKAGVIDIQYPVVSLENTAAEQKINAILAEQAARFRDEAAREPYTQVAQSRYVVHHNTGGILSIAVTNYVFSGGAHGMSYRKGYTFDLASGEMYTFNDLVPNNAREQINREIARQIAENNLPLLQPFTELKPEPDFYLLPGRKMAIFYQLYELAPYAWGFVTFPINY